MSKLAQRSLFLASSLGGGLGLLIPLVALVLVLAYGLGHLPGTPRLFLGFLTLTAFLLALPRSIRLGQTLRVGELKVIGVLVERAEEPRRFWIWVAIEAIFVTFNLVAALVLAWATFHIAP